MDVEPTPVERGTAIEHTAAVFFRKSRVRLVC